MKRIFIVALLAVLPAFVMAQDAHLKFKGIPISGTLTSFVSKLKAKGFVAQGQQDGIALLKGEFAGYKNTIVGVGTFEGTQDVCKVAAFFPQKETWKEISSDYAQLKSFLTEKYGEPECVENIKTHSDNDFLKFHAIINGDFEFYSKFTTEGGVIVLTFVKADYNAVSVNLTYYDDSNTAKVRQQILDDL